MTDTAATLESAEPRHGVLSRGFVPAKPPEWLWAGVVAAQVGVAAVLTSYTYFFVDDFLLLRQAQTQSLGFTYLREALFEHFSPVTRVLNKILVGVAPGSFGFARLIELGFYAAAIIAMAIVLRTILGRTWSALGLTILFGQSVFLMRLLTWWTATANILPATVFMLLATAAYLRWWMSGQKRWFVACLVAQTIALLDYETAILFPVNLVLIRLLVLSDSLGPRAWAKILWRERYLWVGFAALDVAALANYFHGYYSRMPHPTIGQVGHFLDISLLQTFIPGLVGVKQVPSAGTATAVASFVALAVVVGVTLYFRPRSWRCLLVMLLTFLVALLPLGLNRIRLFGVTIGAELYYHQSAHFMFIVLAGFALSRRWGGHRPVEARGWASIPRLVSAQAGAITAIAYTVLYISSSDVLKSQAVLPRATQAYIHRVADEVHRLEAFAGAPELIDLPIPAGLMPPDFAPFNRYSQFFPVAGIKLRYNNAGRPTYVVSASGSLESVHYVLIARSRTTSSTLTRRGQVGLEPAEHRGGQACVPAGPARLLRFPMSRPQRVTPRTGELPYALRIRFTLSASATVPVLLSGGGALTPVDFERHVLASGSGAIYVLVGITSRFDQIALELPGGACISEASLGVFRPQGR